MHGTTKNLLSRAGLKPTSLVSRPPIAQWIVVQSYSNVNTFSIFQKMILKLIAQIFDSGTKFIFSCIAF